MSAEPKIYLSKEDKYLDIKTVNRGNFTFNLSDKFIFSEQEEERDPKVSLGPLDSEQDESLKIEIFSSCSYKNQGNLKPNQEEDGRIVQEFGSRSYIWSFSIFELLPKEILLGPLDDTFYCSFVFAFKNPQEFLTTST